MSLFTKIAGVAAGVSTVAVLGVAIAQGTPPNPLIANHALAAGQQSTHITPMGETGVPPALPEIRAAAVITQEPVAAVPQPQPQVAEAEPAERRQPEVVAVTPSPAPEPVQVAPEPSTSTMGAGRAEPEPIREPRADRN